MIKESKIINSIKKIPTAVILALLIAIAVIRLCYVFSLRDGHHVDETWSLGFANSYYNPHVFGGFSIEELDNIGEWVTGDTFKDYISVSEDQRFCFDSVLYNKRVDLSPPLYELVLHFVSSFFPEQFSWWYAFSISLMCFIPSLILIFLLSFEFTGSRFCAFFTLIYYIFSGCGTNNFLYLRLYHMFTFFSLLLLWIIVRIVKNNIEKKWIWFCFLPLAALMGFLSHLYFLVMAFAFTMFGTFVLLFKKRFKDAFLLCCAMLLSVGLFFVIFPDALSLLLPFVSGNATTSVTGYYSYPYYFDLGVANVHFFKGTLGFFISFTIFDIITILGLVVLGSILIALIVFLFRNEIWMKNAISKTKHYSGIAITYLTGFCKRYDPSILIALLSSIFYLLVIPYSAMLTNMGFTERYFFAAMSVFILFSASIEAGLLKCIYESKKIKTIISRIVVVSLICIFIFLDHSTHSLMGDFQFRNMSEEQLLSDLSGRDVYIIIHHPRDEVWLSTVLYKSDNVYVDLQNKFAEDDFSIPELTKDCLLLIVDDGLLSEEQKNELLNSDSIQLDSLYTPDLMKTLDDIVGDVEMRTGYSYESIGSYKLFIGKTILYECKEFAEE